MPHKPARKLRALPRDVPRIRGSGFRILARGPAEECRSSVEPGPIPFAQAISMADWGQSALASNGRLHSLLIEVSKTPYVHPLRCAFPCASGTITAYVEPGTPFNKSRLFSKNEGAIVFTDEKTGQRHVFPVPHEYAGEKDAVLVSEHPDYQLVHVPEGDELWAVSSKVDCVKGFPSKNAFYRLDKEHGIPQGEEFYSPKGGSGYLCRLDGGGIVPIIRGRYEAHYDSISMDEMPSTPFGALLEAPQEEPAHPPEGSPERRSIRIRGVAPEDFDRMVAAARESLEQLSQIVKETSLEEIRVLLDALGRRG